MARLAGPDPVVQRAVRQRSIQALIVINVSMLTAYIYWRGAYTLMWTYWPISLALYMAELYSYVDTVLFGLGMWRIRVRGEPPPAPPGLSVDVFVTCYNEPVALVRRTIHAARAIRYPHATWLLDDGDSEAMRSMAEAEGVGYLARAPSWKGKQRHAKAGNLINALLATTGEFLLVLDADQVPAPHILDRTLGYFSEPEVALVQTPQWFGNVPPGDPFGVDAPLFYGPIQQGKDGWNSAFFCGSNAVLRREALMFSGVVSYVRSVEDGVRRGLRATRGRFSWAHRPFGLVAAGARSVLRGAARRARVRQDQGAPLQDVTWEFQRTLERVSNGIVESDLRAIRADIALTPGLTPPPPSRDRACLEALSVGALSPLDALTGLRRLREEIDVHRDDQAEPVQPMATISITEDMATAMRLHALGFRSVYHHEVLAVGLAPDDLRGVLIQRLRWAQGSMQVFFRENPLLQAGLSLPQRLMYFSTMWTYLSGFASVVYLLAPAAWLLFGWTPVNGLSWQFVCFLLPCLVVNQLLFALVGHGLPTWRGQQYSLALFPLWIRAVVSAFRNVYFGVEMRFVVTPKVPDRRAHWALVRPQVAVTLLLIVAIWVGVARYLLGFSKDLFPLGVNIAWAVYGIVMLSVVLDAARWQPQQSEEEQG